MTDFEINTGEVRREFIVFANDANTACSKPIIPKIGEKHELVEWYASHIMVTPNSINSWIVTVIYKEYDD